MGKGIAAFHSKTTSIFLTIERVLLALTIGNPLPFLNGINF